MRAKLFRILWVAGLAGYGSHGRASQITVFYTTSTVNTAISADVNPDEPNASIQSTLGFGAEYTFYLDYKVAVKGSFVASMKSFADGLLISGAGGVIAYSVLGGKPLRLQKPDFQMAAAPKHHVFIGAGIAQRTYDLTGKVKAIPPPTGDNLDRPNVSRIGQFFAPSLELGYDFYFTYIDRASMGSLRVGYINAGSPPTKYSFSIIQISLGFSFEV